jgi:hypothetical protein
VTPQLIGEHRELISRYGNYDIITAHVIFKPGAVLDPSRAYFTILREPVDRALSWLYFASYDVAETYEIRGQPEAARDFLRSDGDSSSPLLDEVLRDQYSRHFLRISNASSSVKSSASKIDLALSALSRYSLVGIYDCLEPFMDDLCNALGLQQKSLPIANVTTRRPKVDEISAKLRNQASSGSRIIDYSDEHFEVQTEVSTRGFFAYRSIGVSIGGHCYEMFCSQRYQERSP